MPMTWALRLSNLGRSSWRAKTSRVQVGVKAPMNPKSTIVFLPTSSLRESFSAVVAGSAKSGALSPTSSPAPRGQRSAQVRTNEASWIPSSCSPLSRHQRPNEIDRLLRVPLARPDGPSDDDALAVDDQRHRNPADAVFPRHGHLRIEQHGKAVTMLHHERLDVPLAPAIEGHEIDQEIVRKPRLEILQALELTRACGTPRRA